MTERQRVDEAIAKAERRGGHDMAKLRGTAATLIKFAHWKSQGIVQRRNLLITVEGLSEATFGLTLIDPEAEYARNEVLPDVIRDFMRHLDVTFEDARDSLMGFGLIIARDIALGSLHPPMEKWQSSWGHARLMLLSLYDELVLDCYRAKPRPDHELSAGHLGGCRDVHLR